MHALIHLANVLILLSFLVRDILWLRTLSILAGLCFIVHFGTSSPPGWESIGWNVVFLSLNVVQIVRLLRERRPVEFKPDELALYTSCFRALDPREFARLLAVGTWRRVPAGERLVEQGTALGVLMALCEGSLQVRKDGSPVAFLERGRLVGEMSYLLGTETTASVETKEPCLLLCWTHKELEALVREDSSLNAALQLVIGRDLAAKLQRDRRSSLGAHREGSSA